MKQLATLSLVVLAIAFLAVATFGTVSAGFGYEDPAICVEGQWLVIDAAAHQGVTIYVPEGTAYGDQEEGGCATDTTATVFKGMGGIIKSRGTGSKMLVMIEGKFATPTVTVTYGDQEPQILENTGGMLWADFELP